MAPPLTFVLARSAPVSCAQANVNLEVRKRETAGPCETRGASWRSRFQPGPDGRESLFEFCLIDDAAHQQRVRECNQPVLWIGQVGIDSRRQRILFVAPIDSAEYLWNATALIKGV